MGYERVDLFFSMKKVNKQKQRSRMEGHYLNGIRSVFFWNDTIVAIRFAYFIYFPSSFFFVLYEHISRCMHWMSLYRPRFRSHRPNMTKVKGNKIKVAAMNLSSREVWVFKIIDSVWWPVSTHIFWLSPLVLLKSSQVKSRNSLFLQRKMWVPHIKNKDSVHM